MISEKYTNIKYWGCIAVFILFLLQGNAQFKNTETFVIASTFCSTTYIIDSSGIFFREHGCEGSSAICMGTYTIKKDTITFYFQKMDDIPVVLKVEESVPLNDKSVNITIETRYGQPYRAYEAADVDAVDTSGRFYTRFSLDKNGSFTINNPQQYKALRLNFLEYFFLKWVFVDMRPKNLKLILPLPEMCYRYNSHNSHPDIVTPKPISMLLKNDELSTIHPYPGEKPFVKQKTIE